MACYQLHHILHHSCRASSGLQYVLPQFHHCRVSMDKLLYNLGISPCNMNQHGPVSYSTVFTVIMITAWGSKILQCDWSISELQTPGFIVSACAHNEFAIFDNRPQFNHSDWSLHHYKTLHLIFCLQQHVIYFGTQQTVCWPTTSIYYLH